MKVIELTDDQFQLLGSLISHHLIGNHPEPDNIYRKFRAANNQDRFLELSIDPNKSNFGKIYLQAPTIRRVISYDIPAGRNNTACEEEITKVIKKFDGELISK